MAYEGFGAAATGGAGGVEVAVTNLLGTVTPGSFQYALAAPFPKTITFHGLSGTINNTTVPKLVQDDCTIAGETSPKGITLAGEELRIAADNVIVRNLKIRTGDVEPANDGFQNRDCLVLGTADGGATNVVIANCSLSWSVDEALSINPDSHDITIQDCILHEGLRDSVHPEGVHSFGLLKQEGATRISVLRNLFAHFDGRMPQFVGAGIVDMRNNLIYNWREVCTRLKAIGLEVNIVGNVYIPGPDSIDYAYGGGTISLDADLPSNLKLYIANNLSPDVPTGAEDNWLMMTPGVSTSLRWPTEFAHGTVKTLKASRVQQYVLEHAGAFAANGVRDQIDLRIIKEVRTRTGKVIDSPSEIGGWYNGAWLSTRPFPFPYVN